MEGLSSIGNRGRFPNPKARGSACCIQHADLCIIWGSVITAVTSRDRCRVWGLGFGV